MMRSALLGMFLVMLMAPAAMAQTGKHLALGGGIGVTHYADEDFRVPNPEFAILYRLNLKPMAPDGWYWAPKGDLGWSSKRDVTTDIGGVRTPLGKLQTILVLGGIQRALRQRPWQLVTAVVAGPAFHSFDVDGRARDAYLGRLGRDLGDIEVKTSLAVRPEMQVNYDLSKWFAVQGNLSYLIDRPKADITSGGATTSETWKTDHLSANVGLIVGIF